MICSACNNEIHEVTFHEHNKHLYPNLADRIWKHAELGNIKIFCCWCYHVIEAIIKDDYCSAIFQILNRGMVVITKIIFDKGFVPKSSKVKLLDAAFLYHDNIKLAMTNDADFVNMEYLLRRMKSLEKVIYILGGGNG